MICQLNPIERGEFDGLCISCRAAVADGLYRVHWIYPQPDPDDLPKTELDFYSTERYARHQQRMYRVVEFVSAAVHPLGCEFPNHPDPIPYRPELLPKIWRAIEANVRAEQTATALLTRLEEFGK